MIMQLPRKQRGVTAMGWVIILGLIIGGALLAMKIAPIYMRHGSVLQALHFTAKQEGVARMPLSKIKNIMAKQLNISSVYGFDMTAVRVEKKRDSTDLILDYEVREDIVGNLAVVATFYEVVEIPR
jgi:hypothetical protein